jgi:hypothetical protein
VTSQFCIVVGFVCFHLNQNFVVVVVIVFISIKTLLLFLMLLSFLEKLNPRHDGRLALVEGLRLLLHSRIDNLKKYKNISKS